MDPLRIEVVSDFVCPWCYVGKRRLEAALAARPRVSAEVSWSPFQLSPDMPRAGRDRRAHYAQVFGEERARMIVENMAETARGEGLEFRLLPGARSPNTLSAHVLVHWADHDPGVDAPALVERLFHAHHVDCEDIGDLDVLARLAGAAGMDAGTVRARLAAGEDEGVLAERIRAAAARGVTGVPFFIFNERYGFAGAQPADAIAELIDRIARAA